MIDVDYEIVYEVRKNSILIVDDEKLGLEVLTHILSPEYNIYTAKNGKTAVEIAKEYLPDLILLDIIMPEMDGYEVLSILKTHSKTKDIPIICITGLSGSDSEQKVLSLEASDYISKPFNSAIVQLRVRNQIQLANQRHAIEHLIMIDELTDIPNRRYFDNQIKMEWNQAIRDKAPLSIFMMDIDHFKDYNDTYGHAQGDIALQVLAKSARQMLRRPSDMIARWGGEEFVALLPDTNLKGALDVAERIRANIEKITIYCADGTATNITLSIGVNTQIPNQGDSMDHFISYADVALYQAKKAKRNAVCWYDGSTAAESALQMHITTRALG